MPCLTVESSRGRRVERSVRERPKKVYEKESLKGSRTESLSERARKNDTVPCRKNRIFTRFKKWKLSERSQRVIPTTYALGGSRVLVLKRTPVLAAGFQLEGNLCHFTKSCTSSRSIGIPILPGDQESEIALALLGRHKHSSC